MNEFYDSNRVPEPTLCGPNVNHSSADPTCSRLLTQKLTHLRFEMNFQTALEIKPAAIYQRTGLAVY